jgi:hypothetical protein
MFRLKCKPSSGVIVIITITPDTYSLLLRNRMHSPIIKINSYYLPKENIVFLDIMLCRFSCLKCSVLETGFCFHLEVEPTQLAPTIGADPCLLWHLHQHKIRLCINEAQHRPEQTLKTFENSMHTCPSAREARSVLHQGSIVFG